MMRIIFIIALLAFGFVFTTLGINGINNQNGQKRNYVYLFAGIFMTVFSILCIFKYYLL